MVVSSEDRHAQGERRYRSCYGTADRTDSMKEEQMKLRSSSRPINE